MRRDESMLRQAPALDASAAVRLASEVYGVHGRALPLPSERDQNFRIETGSGSFVLKLANALESRDLLEAQNAAMQHAGRRGARCPQPVEALDGRILTVTADGYFLRLLTWIPGIPLGQVRDQSDDLLDDLGRRVGELGRALLEFDHPAVHRDFYWDLAGAPERAQRLLHLVEDRDWRALLDRELRRTAERLAPAWPRLRRSTIHNDANDYNVIVDREGGLFGRHRQVVGLIDFGDMVHSFTAGDAAISAAYAALDKRAPLRAAARVVSGYHAALPLESVELDAVFDLLKLRLCLSACLAASQQAERPGDSYLVISQGPIRRTLPALCGIPPSFATAAFREACGMDPAPAAARITRMLAQNRPRATWPVVSAQGSSAQQSSANAPVVVDLSPGSPLIAARQHGMDAAESGRRIDAVLRESGAVGIGRHLEPRLSRHAAGGDRPGKDPDTIHLGIDLFAPAGTAVRAPLAGRVHLVAGITSPAEDPLLVLQHVEGGVEFYTLYRGLARDSVAPLRTGEGLAAGVVFARIGPAEAEAGWPPHLHFQVVVDLLDLGPDFPRVCSAEERPLWSLFSPDPALVLELPPGVDGTFRQASASATLAARRSHIGGSLRVSYRHPVKIVRGCMQYLFDETGRRYLDAYNNVPHVGHCHPRVVEAAAAQMRVLNTNTRYLHDALDEFAARLTATLPPPLRSCYFVNSGSEANELALRLARAHTGRRDVIVLEHAYHGNTTGLIDISPYKFDGPGGRGRPSWVHVAPLPDVFRGSLRGGAAGTQYAGFVQRIIESMPHHSGGPAAFIAETCPSVGGQIVAPPGYFAAAYEHVRAAGGVCIADEVQTAYGRPGSSFYAFEHQQVVPDILVLGKPIGNGHPLGAVVTTREIAASFDNGMEFFSTFGGNTVSCVVGLAVLDVLEDEGLQAHAARVGAMLVDRLNALASRHPLVGDVRGSGLFLGVDLVTDRESRAPATEAAEYVVNRLRDEGILIGTEGPSANVLKIRPPMPFSETDAVWLVEKLDEVLAVAED